MRHMMTWLMHKACRMCEWTNNRHEICGDNYVIIYIQPYHYHTRAISWQFYDDSRIQIRVLIVENDYDSVLTSFELSIQYAVQSQSESLPWKCISKKQRTCKRKTWKNVCKIHLGHHHTVCVGHDGAISSPIIKIYIECCCL